MKKKQMDERITLRNTWRSNFFLMLAVLFTVNGGYLMIFMSVYGIEPTLSNMLRIEPVSYVIFFSVILAAVTTAVRNSALAVPVQRLAEAARRITKGDYAVRLAPLRKDGKKDHMQVLYDDFNTMAEELSSTETLKTDFIVNVSHEIKTPLAVIQSYATALQQAGLQPDQRAEYAKTIMDASQKLSALVSNILKLNKLESQGILPRGAPFDLSEQLRCCALAFEEMWERKALSFEADIADDVRVAGDEAMLELVWNNLLANAIKFTEPGGAVKLELKAEGEWAAVSVMDTGCGMNEVTARHVFDKFFQGDTSHSQEGNGLGLALAHRVVELMGGTIQVESVVGRGTTFVVRLKAK